MILREIQKEYLSTRYVKISCCDFLLHGRSQYETNKALVVVVLLEGEKKNTSKNPGRECCLHVRCILLHVSLQILDNSASSN